MTFPAQPTYLAYWGKTSAASDLPSHHPLPYHCLDVAAVAQTLLKRDRPLLERLIATAGIPGPVLGQLICFLFSLHDLGKFSIRFQGLRPDLLAALQGRTPQGGYNNHHGELGLWLWREHARKDVLGLPLLPIPDPDLGAWNEFLWPWALACFGHHGAPVPLNDEFRGDHFEQPDINAARAFVRDTAALFLRPGQEWDSLGAEPSEALWALCATLERASWFVAGLAVLADWIASDQRHFPLCPRPMPLQEYWERHALPQAEAAVVHSGVLAPAASQRESFGDLLPHLRGNAPSPLQSLAASEALGADGPTLFIFEDQTGSGKTEAALLCAHGLMRRGLAEGIYVALPTMATANAMYERMATAYHRLFAEGGRASLVLAHAGRDLSERFQSSLGLERIRYGEESTENGGGAFCAAWLADNRKKSLLATVGVGTIDQALLAVLPSRHQSLRLLGLGRSVLVVDEVHAYDPYMHKLLCNLLAFHAAQGGSAILLSATLPCGTRRKLVAAFHKGLGENAPALHSRAFPLATASSRRGAHETALTVRPGTERAVNVEFVHSVETMQARIAEAARAGACVLWVRNTVKDTLEAHDRLSGLLGTRNVILFHARFAHCDRLAIEESVLTRFGKDSPADGRRGMVVVATQVAEQSLDLDFDLVLSDLAPMENLLQRSGRCCRHPRDDRPGSVSGPRLVVLSPPLDAEPDKNWFASMSSGSARVYPLQGPLWLAARLLRERGGFRLPEDARELLEAVYGEEAKERVPKALATADLPVEGQLLGAMAWANTNMLKLSSGYKREDTPWAEDERSPTRLGEESVRLRLCRWENGVLSPWHADGDALRRWAMSEMNAPHWMIYDVPPLADSALRLAVDQAVARMPDQRRWAKILPLTPAGDAWHGVGLDEQGGLVNVRYSRTRGLEVVKGGGG